jgi:hypothetical protein
VQIRVNTYVIWWDPSKSLNLGSRTAVHTPFGSSAPSEGDVTYIITLGQNQRLLARLGVMGARVDDSLQRTIVTSDRFVTAVFSRDVRTGHLLRTPIRMPNGIQHKQATVIGDWESDLLRNMCEQNNDYSRQYLPINWGGIVNKTLKYITRIQQSSDERSDLEIAVTYLLANHPTCELPGPAPVYLNAARIITGNSNDVTDPSGYMETYGTLDGSGTGPGAMSGIFCRRSVPLTESAIKAGINANLTKMSLYSPDARRHQEILLSLRNRLVVLGLDPQYDRLIDCKVVVSGSPVYFEVKSSQPENMLRETMLGVGQLEYYQWLDIKSGLKDIIGHVVLEDRVKRRDTIPKFVQALGMGFTWSTGLEGLKIGDLKSETPHLMGEGVSSTPL